MICYVTVSICSENDSFLFIRSDDVASCLVIDNGVAFSFICSYNGVAFSFICSYNGVAFSFIFSFF